MARQTPCHSNMKKKPSETNAKTTRHLVDSSWPQYQTTKPYLPESSHTKSESTNHAPAIKMVICIFICEKSSTNSIKLPYIIALYYHLSAGWQLRKTKPIRAKSRTCRNLAQVSWGRREFLHLKHPWLSPSSKVLPMKYGGWKWFLLQHHPFACVQSRMCSIKMLRHRAVFSHPLNINWTEWTVGLAYAMCKWKATMQCCKSKTNPLTSPNGSTETMIIFTRVSAMMGLFSPSAGP